MLSTPARGPLHGLVSLLRKLSDNPRVTFTFGSCLYSTITFTLRLFFIHLIKKKPLNALPLLYFT